MEVEKKRHDNRAASEKCRVEDMAALSTKPLGDRDSPVRTSFRILRLKHDY